MLRPKRFQGFFVAAEWVCLTVLVLHSHTLHAANKCTIVKLTELPITMNSLRPMIAAKINGQEAQFILDSGAFYSMVSSATATEYKLKPVMAAPGFYISGIGGATSAEVAEIKEFSVAALTLKKIQFLVGGSDTGTAGLLGQNFLERFDVEYDLAKGIIRLFRSENCEGVNLAYWLSPQQTYSAMDIDHVDAWHPHTIGRGEVNGEKIRIEFDTGAFTSVLSLRAADHAGLRPDSPGVIDAGYGSGIGRNRVRTYIGNFSNFKVGDAEEIRNAKIRFEDMGIRDSDMLLGADFFVSHHIFVANKEHRLFLTYNGGPVFNLTRNLESQTGSAASGTAPANATPDASGEKAANDSSASPQDPAELARLGSALAARHDFASGLADLTKAIELRPEEAEYYFQRANALLGNNQPELALADLDRVLALKQDFLPAYIPRAEIKLAKKDKDGAIADLDAVDRLAPQEADLRFALGELNEHIERMPIAVLQFSRWIEAHPYDARMQSARESRCFAAALSNQDLNTASHDCDFVVRHADKKDRSLPYFYADRALVRLRLGDYGKAVDDCDTALKHDPRNARALFIRAVAKARENDLKASAEDVQAAQTLEPDIAHRFAHFGIAP